MAVEAQHMKSLHSDSMMSFRGMDLSDSMQRGGGGGGGGRRKQSKPIRVFMDMAAVGTEPIDSRPPEALDAMPELTDPKSSSPRNIEMMDMDEAFSCDLCNDTFMTQSALTDHIQQSHDLNGKGGNSDVAYPTKYHQLGSELQQEIGLPTSEEEAAAPTKASTPVESTTPSTPSFESNGRHNGPSPDAYHDINSEGEIIRPPGSNGENGKSRIFHKDAFCKMCDREFCNKYFLKTHMANKHGIYESGSPPSSTSPKMFGNNGDSNSAPSFAETLAMLPSVSGAGGFSAFAPPLPMPNMAESPKSSTPAPPPPLLPPSMPSLAATTTSSNSPQKYQLPMLPSLAPKQQRQSPSSLPPTKTTSSSSSSSSSSKPVSKDMEDYCEICQKHFCNKYYLKKHKQDVHGIIPEPNTGNTGKRSRSNNSSNNSSSSSAAAAAAAAVAAVSSSNSMSPLTDVMSNAPMGGHLPPGLDGMPPGLGNVMFINPFAPPFALLQNQSASVLQQAAAAAAGFPPGLPLPTPPTPGHQQPSPMNNTSPGSLPPPPSSSSNSASTNGEQRNPEAYCDLCRKEFCNIHFLKIHKANKHGVIYEDLANIIQQASLSQLPVLNVPSLPPTSSTHSEPSPPGGVIHIAPTAQESGVKVKAEKPDAARGEPEPRPLDLFPSPAGPGASPLKGEPCAVCKKEFNNKYSLQIHMINAHNMKPSDLDMALGLGPAEPKSEHLLQGTMFSNMIAAKLADRVMCDICNKEVCNKYFLKTHKLKVHGIETTSNNGDRENESPPRSKGISSVIKSSPQGGRPASTEPNKMPTTPTKPDPGPSPLPPRPNDEELLKMGIDPEAYCEICKKEFCSKYFLKTHRANIHGIKSSSSGSQSPEKNDKPIFSSNHKPSFPNQSSFLPHGFPPLDGKDLPGFPGLPGLPGLPVSLAQSLSSLGGGGGPMSLPPLPSQAGMLPGFPPENWPWKDQIYNQRVRCDICNKDVNNRFFLKTHMINKHGLNYDPLTGTTTPLPPSSQPNNECAASAPGATDMQPENLSMKPADDRSMTSSRDGGEGDESRISAKTWHVPPSGEEKESEQAVNNNNNKENMPSSSQGGKVSSKGGKCVLCGLQYSETVALQLHMIQDHQGQVTVTPEGGSSSAAQLVTFNLKKKYQRTMKKTRRLRRFGPSVGGAIGEKVRSAIVNHIASHQKKSKKFRCAHCNERFLSRPQCTAHIRQAHPGVRAGSSDRSTLSTTKSSLSSSSQQNAATTAAATPMDTNDSSAVMQSFSLQEQDGGPKRRVAASVVQLPVFDKISEPVSVTFTLTPM